MELNTHFNWIGFYCSDLTSELITDLCLNNINLRKLKPMTLHFEICHSIKLEYRDSMSWEIKGHCLYIPLKASSAQTLFSNEYKYQNEDTILVTGFCCKLIPTTGSVGKSILRPLSHTYDIVNSIYHHDFITMIKCLQLETMRHPVADFGAHSAIQRKYFSLTPLRQYIDEYVLPIRHVPARRT